MANTFSQIYIQTVFAVEGRNSLIHPEWKDELYKYITGIVRNKGSKLLAINGMPDHIHILLGLKPNISVSELVKEIKRSSNGFINEKRWVKGRFAWQKGFGAFSYSRSHIDSVIQYIHNQEKHHQKRSFRDEYIEMLHKFEIKYDDQYLFDFLT